MYSYTVWTEGGGEGKTVLAAGLAKAHVEQGYDVLAVDMDGQKGGLSSWYGLLNKDKTPNGDSIVEFLADAAEDDFEDLIQTVEGIDFVPSSRRLRDLDTAIYRIGGPRQQEVPDQQLRRLIEQEELYNDYDVMIIDVPKEVHESTKNALYATRNVLVPIKLGPKGEFSVDGIVENLHSYELRKQIEIGVIGMVANDVNMQLRETQVSLANLKRRLEQYEEQADRKVPLVPIVFGHRESLFKEAWREQVSPQKYFNEHRDRQRDREKETIESFTKLSEYVLYQLSAGEEGSIPEPHKLIQDLEVTS